MLLAVIVFISVFLVVALLITASGAGASERVKRTLARLDALLVAGSVTKDEQIDVQKQELLSAIPFLNQILMRLEIAPSLRRLLYQANLKWTPGTLLLMTFAVWVVAAYLIDLRTEIFLVSLILALIPAAIPFVFVLHKRNRRFEKFEGGLPAALDIMVAGLRGGHSLASVLELVSREGIDPIGPEFRICFDEQNYGLELRTALQNLSVRVPIQDVRIIMTAILVQKETGGNLAEVLEKCAYIIRDRFRLKREIRTKTAQGRLTGWVLSFLPVVLGIALFMINPEHMSVLWTRPVGEKLLYACSVMTLTGALIIRKIVRIRV